MCGRMTQQTSPEEVARIFDAEMGRSDEPFLPSWNVAPTDPVTVVLERDEGRLVERHRWGLIPTWADSPAQGARLINARAETVMESPAFRIPFRRRRCIVPADGFYEWLRRDGKRQPFFLHPAEGSGAGTQREAPILAFAGLWSIWKDPATGIWVPSSAVITTGANERVAPVHDRMPVILGADAWDTWLDPLQDDLAYLRSLLVPAADDVLEIHAVPSLVNSVRNNGPELIERIDPADTGGQLPLLG